MISSTKEAINTLICACAEGAHPSLGRIIRRHDGKVQLRITAPAGRRCVVEVSTNLVDWVELGPATELGDCNFVLEDAQAAGTPARFYRVVVR